MVRADDEHKSANKAEKNNSTHKNFFEKLKFWHRDKKDANEPARLKTLPKCLMHWLTPVWIAATGFVIALTFAVYWHGTRHWPSAEAMKLCATIAGAGFAFSAWQQRSHDNAANAKQAQATAEREDYWKRREQIYQLLGSKSPGLRLSAVALLAELADTAAHSALLNDTEKQQLQRHIIDTLCLQVRHEGLCIKEEGDKREHTTLQQTIFTSILQRIDHLQQDGSVANWTESKIGLNDCTILSSVAIRSIDTNSTLDFRGTTFEERVEISESKIKCILWHNAHFNSRLDVTDRSDIGMTHPPAFGKLVHFRDTTIRSAHTRDRFIIPLVPNIQKTKIVFTSCRFYDTSCKCPRTCKCRLESNTNICQCSTKNTCTCKNTCINTPLRIITPSAPHEEEEHYPEITIQNCTVAHLSILPTELGARTTIKSNLIHETLRIFIGYRKATDAVRTYMYNTDKLITLKDNVIQIPDNPRFSPIAFQSNTYANIDNVISFNNMSLRQGATSARESKVIFQKIPAAFDLFHFATVPSFDRRDTLTISWDTGSLSSTYHKALACNINGSNKLFEIQMAKNEHLDFVTQAYEATRKIMSEYAMETDWHEDNFSVGDALEDIEDSNCYIVYHGGIPSAAFTLKQSPNATDQENSIHWRSNMNHYMIQRISAVREYAVAQSIFGYATTRASYLRCLTHERNNILCHALEEFGFKECGRFTAEDGTTRVAYDWIKEPDSQN